MHEETIKLVVTFHGWGHCVEFPSVSALTVLVGWQEGHLVCKKPVHLIPSQMLSPVRNGGRKPYDHLENLCLPG